MPGVSSIITADDNCHTDIEHIENVHLVLPSEINPTHWGTTCSLQIQEIKARLQEAQCQDALQDLCNKLHAINHLYHYKKLNVQHQGPNTWVCSDIASKDKQKLHVVHKYCCAWLAKLALLGHRPWEAELHILNDSNICGLDEDDPANCVAVQRQREVHNKAILVEGWHKLLWIWCTSDAKSTDRMVDSLHVEWLKARACVMCWCEEVRLLLEEMWHMLVSHQHSEQLWTAHINVWENVDPALHQGLQAYAYKQASMYCAMHRTFYTTCLVVALTTNSGIGAEWADDGGFTIPVAAEGEEPSHLIPL